MTTHVAVPAGSHQCGETGLTAHTSIRSGTVPAPENGDQRRMQAQSIDHRVTDELRGVNEGRAANPHDVGVDSVRRTLIGAITTSIRDKRFSAAQAALQLQLTGPRVTDLFYGYVDAFSVDELIELLPRLGLSIQVVPESMR